MVLEKRKAKVLINYRGDIVRQVTKGILVGALLLVFAIAGFAQVEVSGTIDSDVTWDQPEYRVTGDIYVTGGATLTIDPGTKVEFAPGGYAIEVKGKLIARGQVAEAATAGTHLNPNEDIDWVHFTQDVSGMDLSSPSNEDWNQLWRGIRFDESEGGSIIEWAIVENSYARGEWPDNNGGGIFIRQTSPSVTKTVIRNCRAANFGGGVFIWASNAEFRNNVIADNLAAVAGGGLYMDLSQFEIHNCTIVRNDLENGNLGRGTFFGPGSSPVVRSSILFHNGDSDGEDNGIFDAGERTINEPRRMYCLDTSAEEDLSTSVFGDESLYDAEIPIVGFVEGDPFYTLGYTSRAIDAGAPDNDGYVNEPAPNGGPGGPRINLGAWGGTALATPSLPVCRVSSDVGIVVPNSRVTLQEMHVNDVQEGKVFFKNTGNGVLEIQRSKLFWIEGFSDHEDRYEIPAFTTIRVKPDSIAFFDFIFNPELGDEGNTPEEALFDSMVFKYKFGGEDRELHFQFKATIRNPVMEITGVPEGGYDFGNVNVGEEVTRTFTLRNSGTTNLEGISYSLLESYFEVEDGVSHTLAAGAEEDITITTALRNIGPVTDNLTISARNLSTEMIALAAVGFGPVVSFDPEPRHVEKLDFKFADIDGDQVRDTLYVRNTGNATLSGVKARVEVSEGIESPDFYLNDSEGNLISSDVEMEVAAEDELMIVIVFDPASLGDKEATFTVETEQDWNTAEYTAVGKGTQGGQYFDGNIPAPAFGVNEVWGIDGNDLEYVCAGPTFIPAGERIVINKGVNIRFEPGAFIQVEGTLEVLGEEGEEVHFTNLIEGERHSGLRLLGANDATRIEYAVIDSATTWVKADIEDWLEDEMGVEDADVDEETHVLANGGGLAIYNCNPTLKNVLVKDNFSHRGGGGIWMYQSAPTITNCVVDGNEATTDGGGIVLWGSMPEFHANTVNGNTAGENGGGIYFRSFADAVITNSIISANVAGANGGGVYMIQHSSPSFMNNVFYGNTATEIAEALYVSGRATTVVNGCVINDHTTDNDIFVDPDSRMIARYSIIEGMNSGTVVDVDPDWTGPNGATPFMPNDSSPMIDGGDVSVALNDRAFPPSMGEVRGDIGIYGGPYAGAWGGTPLAIRFFSNGTTGRSLHIIVNATEVLGATPELSVYSDLGTSQLALTAIGNGQATWEAIYSIDRSQYFDAEVSATVSGDLYRIRRSLAVTIYSPSEGAVLASPDGSKLVMAPGMSANEQLVSAETAFNASMPVDMNDADVIGERWNINADASSWLGSAELVMPYDASLVRNGQETALSIWHQTEEGWEQIESMVDPESKTVHGQVKASGEYMVLLSASGSASELLPQTSALGANYPNPFNPTTTIPFELNSASKVVLSVYNVLGQKVATVASGSFGAGHHNVVWNGQNRSGQTVASGVYLYRLETMPSDGSKGIMQTRKLVLMR